MRGFWVQGILKLEYEGRNKTPAIETSKQPLQTMTESRNCDNCGKPYQADSRNIKRGWGLCCSKSCAAKKREKSKPGYDPKRVERNNIRRETWNVIESNHYGDFTGRYTSEGYRIFGNTAIDEFDEPVYDLTYL